MSPVSPEPASFKLSICISTFNRAALIGATLESIITQATDECEIVVLDGASTDDTERVVSEWVAAFDRLRYVRQDTNNGVDRDFDRAVELARGEFCWLLPDDDLLKPGAVAAVLEALRRSYSLVVVNTEDKDANMANVLQQSRLGFSSDRVYGPGEMDRLFAEAGAHLSYTGSVVIDRAIWLARARVCYYGSMFIHVGVIFQAPLPGETLVMAKPYISYRHSSAHAWWPKLFEIFMFRWPALVWSLAPSESAKRKVCSAEPWREFRTLLQFRAFGVYSLAEYWRWIHPRVHSIWETMIPTVVALLPGVLVNALYVFYCSVVRGRDQPLMLQWMKESRFYLWNWLGLKREL